PAAQCHTTVSIPPQRRENNNFAEIAKKYIELYQKKVLILTHRIELSKQTSDVLAEKCIANTIINSSVKSLPDREYFQCYTALVETLNNRLQENDKFLEGSSLVMVDEAHYKC